MKGIALLFLCIALAVAAPSPTIKENLAQIAQNAGKLQVCGNNLGTSGFLNTMTCGSVNLLLNTVAFDEANGDTPCSNAGATCAAGTVADRVSRHIYVEPLVITDNGIYEYADEHGRAIGIPSAQSTGAIRPNAQGCFTLFFQRIPTLGTTAVPYLVNQETFTNTRTQCDLAVGYTRTEGVHATTAGATVVAKVNQVAMKIENKGQSYFSDSYTYFFEGSGLPNMFPGMPNEGQYINYVDLGVFTLAANTGRNPTGTAVAARDQNIRTHNTHKANSGQIRAEGEFAAVAAGVVAGISYPAVTGNRMTTTGDGYLVAADLAVLGYQRRFTQTGAPGDNGKNMIFLTSINNANPNVASAVSGTAASGALTADGGEIATDRIVKCFIYYSTDKMIKCRRGSRSQDAAVQDDDDIFIDSTLLIGGDRLVIATPLLVGNDEEIQLPTGRVVGSVIGKQIPTVNPANIVGANPVTIPQNADEITIKGSGFVPAHRDTYLIRFGFEGVGVDACLATSGLSFLPSIFFTGRVAAAAAAGDQVTAAHDAGHNAGIILDFGFWGATRKAAVPKVCQPTRISSDGTELVCKLTMRFPSCHTRGCGAGGVANVDGCTAEPALTGTTLQVQIHTGFQSSSHTQIQEIGIVTYVEPKVDASSQKVAYADIISFTITGQGFDINYSEMNKFYFQFHDGTITQPTTHCVEHQRTTANPTAALRRSATPGDLVAAAREADLNLVFAANHPAFTATTAAGADTRGLLYSADQCLETGLARGGANNLAKIAYQVTAATGAADFGGSRCAVLDRTGTRMVCHIVTSRPLSPATLFGAGGLAAFLAKEPEIQVADARVQAGAIQAAPIATAYLPSIVSTTIPYYYDAITGASGVGARHLVGLEHSGVAAMGLYLDPTLAAIQHPFMRGASNVGESTSAVDFLEHRGAVAVAVNGVVGGDPHFFGLLGEEFFFNGENGQTYSILSDSSVQVNGQLQQYHWRRGKATVFRSVGVKFAGNTILFDAGANNLAGPEASVSVNNNKLNVNSTEAHSLGGASLTWKQVDTTTKLLMPQFKHHVVAIAELHLNNYEFLFAMIEEGKDENGVWHQQPQRFIDFSVRMHNSELRPHGILGQTAHLRKGVRSVADFTIEGEASDYKVSNIFAHDSVFNKFNN